MKTLQNRISMQFALLLSGANAPSLRREEGQTLAEYAMILALIAVLVAVSLTFLKGKITDMFTTIGNSL